MLDRTKAKENWQGKRVLVLGMARSGIAVAQLLCRFGAVPLLNDRKTEQELGEALAPLRELPCEWHLGEAAAVRCAADQPRRAHRFAHCAQSP